MRQGESLAQIATDASRTALERAGVKPADLDAIIVGTVSSEYAFPSFACQIQHGLGISSIPAFDVAAACSGFVYALQVADAQMRAGDFKRVLVVGADALSTMVDWNDRRTAVLFGDGAGACVMVTEPGNRGSAVEPAALRRRTLEPALGPRHRNAQHDRLRSAAQAPTTRSR